MRFRSKFIFLLIDVWLLQCHLVKRLKPFSIKLSLPLFQKSVGIFIWAYCLVTQLYPTLCDAMDCSMPGFPVLHCLLEFASIMLVMPLNHLILCHPLLILLSAFPSIRVFSSKSALWVRWPKYWSFSFSISPSNEFSRLISFRIDYLIFLLSRGFSKVFSSTTIQKHQLFSAQSSLWSNSNICTWLLEKP